MTDVTDVREPGFRNPGNFCLWNPESSKCLLWNPEFCSLESGMQLKESGIPPTIGIQNPSSTEKDLESTAWNSKSRLSWIALHGAIANDHSSEWF